ncbi:MAG: hypothetical protein J6I72_07120 [Muribaculaceae bacterium]|nr:hypothetical protein [Muribaculaceae bacterium]
MKRGYLHSVVWVVLVTVLALLGLYWLPAVKVGDWQMRRIDLLADLRPDSVDNESEQLDSVPAKAQAAKAYADTCKAGITCINDMSDTTDRGMTPLYDALMRRNELGRPVRIAVLGDSYIEGDIFTADLRELLQRHYGGSGAGFVPASSQNPGFRRSVRQVARGWTEYSANEHHGYSTTWANLTGHYFTAGNGAYVELSGVKNYLSLLDTCTTSSFYFAGTGSAGVRARINGGNEQYFTASAAGNVGMLTVTGRMGRVRWTIDRPAGGMVYLGASMETESGVVVDNFALRSASGLHLRQVSQKMLADLDQVRHYDLVIVMYGLNVAGKQASEFASYRKAMTDAIEHMKAAMPSTGFLIVSVGDREQKSGGSYRTLRGVLSLINVQQQMAYDTRVAFWNLYTAMGGQGSIVSMVQNHEANLDYTHINFRGGHRLARLLYDAITWGEQTYTRHMTK